MLAAPHRFPAGQEHRREPAQEDRERQHPDRQHRHGHGQDQGTPVSERAQA